MKLLLKRSVDRLGRLGDVVEVATGYARNYLIPNGFGIAITSGSLAEIDRLRAKAKLEEVERVKSLRDVAVALTEVSITFESRANAEGHLFGSVNAAQVASALREKGFDIDERNVRLEAPIKEIGVFQVPLHLHADVEGEVKVWVVQAKPE